MIDDVNFPHPGADITIFPPENACEYITDEDSGDEDNVYPNNLPGSQLRAPAEINLTQQEDEDTGFDAEDHIPLAQLQSTNADNSVMNKKRTIETPCVWICKDFEEYASEEWPTESTNELKQMIPLQLFEMFFDEDIIEHIVTETNRYASQKNKPDNISSQELKCFLGVLIISGYIQLPRRRMFWEREKDTHNDLVASAISRDRFEFLMTHLHLTDNNTIDKNDRFAKMRPLFTHLNKIFLKFATLQESHSVDEAMVPYYGRHGCKQYIHGKPIRYGFKLWMGCTRLGYVNWFEPYQGATTHTGTEYRHLGVGAGVVLTYADTLKSWYRI
ncbi:Transposase IS4 [Popillia japonica]|uniref:Transposase IS4 n=1 Tax=Popillia japonica TaxID=7064 RepID=A0AAW1KM68_POPJA